jgi:glutamine synthetase
LESAIDGLLADQDYLTYQGVFPAELINKWIQVKRKDIAEMQRIPHPWEVARYYDL